MPKMHGYLRMFSTLGVRDYIRRCSIFPARGSMNAKCINIRSRRTDRAVAAAYPRPNGEVRAWTHAKREGGALSFGTSLVV